MFLACGKILLYPYTLVSGRSDSEAGRAGGRRPAARSAAVAAARRAARSPPGLLQMSAAPGGGRTASVEPWLTGNCEVR